MTTLIFIISAIANAVISNIFKTSIYDYLAIQANGLFFQGYFWTPLTSVFMHAGFFHLFVNMFSLFFLGNFLETIIGRKRFFWFYLVSGIFASLFFCVFAFASGSNPWLIRLLGNSETFAVGASGAIFAITGVLAVLTPKNKVYLILGPLIAIILQTIVLAIWDNSSVNAILNTLISVYVLISIFSIMSFSPSLRKIAMPIEMPFWAIPLAAIVPLMIISLFVDLPIGNTAHLGGFLFGVAYGFYLKIKYKKKVRLISEHFSR